MKTWKRLGLTFVLLLVCLLLQGVLLRALLPSAVVPNLTLLLVIAYAFNQPNPLGALVCFAIGLIQDASTGVLLGPWAGAYVAVFGVCSSLSQRIFVESWLAGFCVAAASSTLASIVYVVLLSQFRPVPVDTAFTILLEAIITGVFASLLSPIFKRVASNRERSVRI